MTEPEVDSGVQIGRAQAVRDVVVQMFGRVGNLALGMVATVVLVNALGVEGNGQWATIFAVATLLGIVGEFGLEPTAVAMAARHREEEGRWIAALMVLRVALALPASIGAALVCWLVSTDTDMTIAGALVSATVLLSTPQSLRAVFQLRVRNDIPILVMTFNSVIWCAAIAAIALSGGGLVAFAAAFLGTQFLTSILQGVLALRVLPLPRRDLVAPARELFAIGFKIGIGTALTVAYAKIDQVLVLELAGERDAGLYGGAYVLLDRLQFLPAAIMTTAFPLLAAAWPSDPVRVRRLTQQILELMVIVSVPVLAFTLVTSENVMTTLFGGEFADAGAALPILMGAFVLIAVGYLLGFLAIVVGAQDMFLRIALVGLAVNVAVNLVVIPAHGFVGAAWTTLGTEVLVCVLAARTVFGRLDMSPALGRLARVVAAGAVVSALVGAADLAGLPFGALVVVAAVSYPAAVVGLRAVPPDELGRARDAVARKLGR